MTAKIIRLIDEHTAVINAGADDGIAVRDRFGIFTPEDPIVDPDTGETLGNYRRQKGVLVVDEVFPRFCVASAPAVRESIIEEMSVLGFGGTKRQKTVTRRDLDVATGQVRGLPTGDEVRVGDIVEVLASSSKRA